MSVKIKFRPNTIMLGYCLFLTLLGVYENVDSWRWSSFLFGLIVMLPLMTIWISNRFAGLLLTIAGFGGLLSMTFIDFSKYEINRLFFVGGGLGFLLGFIPAYLINRATAAEFLLKVVRMDGYEDWAKKLEEIIRVNKK